MYYFTLGYLPLPITPSAINIKSPSQNETVTLINRGEINIPRTRGLTEISFEFMLPRHDYPFAIYSLGNYTATVFKYAINAWATSRIPFYFIMVRMLPNGMPADFEFIKVLIEDFDYDEDAEAQGDDVMCSITLKEYREYQNLYTYVEDLGGGETTSTQQQANRPVESGKQVKTDKNTSAYEQSKMSGASDQTNIGELEEDFSDIDAELVNNLDTTASKQAVWENSVGNAAVENIDPTSGMQVSDRLASIDKSVDPSYFKGYVNPQISTVKRCMMVNGEGKVVDIASHYTGTFKKVPTMTTNSSVNSAALYQSSAKRGAQEWFKFAFDAPHKAIQMFKNLW